jgi:hypothetical protein
VAKKKSKRPNLSQETLERARAEMRGERLAPTIGEETASNGSTPVAPMMAGTAKQKQKRAGSPLATRHIPSSEELLKEYSYVLTDLRNLAILAGILLLVLVIAAVALPRVTG